ncbi:hypothetical protein CHS0354_020656, partial [Potamilus streckersoni]
MAARKYVNDAAWQANPKKKQNDRVLNISVTLSGTLNKRGNNINCCQANRNPKK